MRCPHSLHGSRLCTANWGGQGGVPRSEVSEAVLARRLAKAGVKETRRVREPATGQGRTGIRAMRETDLDAVLAIERGANEFPWSGKVFADCLRAGHACAVLERAGFVDAFGILEVRGAESRVLNLCVRLPVQGQGLGRMLLGAILDTARRRGADTLTLEVRTTNRRARLLYESMGFHETGVRPGYYPAARGREDALILARNLIPQGTPHFSGALQRTPLPG